MPWKEPTGSWCGSRVPLEDDSEACGVLTVGSDGLYRAQHVTATAPLSATGGGGCSGNINISLGTLTPGNLGLGAGCGFVARDDATGEFALRKVVPGDYMSVSNNGGCDGDAAVGLSLSPTACGLVAASGGALSTKTISGQDGITVSGSGCGGGNIVVKMDAPPAVGAWIVSGGTSPHCDPVHTGNGSSIFKASNWQGSPSFAPSITAQGIEHSTTAGSFRFTKGGVYRVLLDIAFHTGTSSTVTIALYGSWQTPVLWSGQAATAGGADFRFREEALIESQDDSVLDVMVKKAANSEEVEVRDTTRILLIRVA